MSEPLLHFAIPFSSFLLLSISLKRALIASSFALLPDFDVLVHIHRSASHSIFVLGLVSLVAYLMLGRTGLRGLVVLSSAAALSHVFLDLFAGYTPLLWPFVNVELWVSGGLLTVIGSYAVLIPSAQLRVRELSFEYFELLEAPIFTSEGLAITLLLLSPLIITRIFKLLSARAYR